MKDNQDTASASAPSATTPPMFTRRHVHDSESDNEFRTRLVNVEGSMATLQLEIADMKSIIKLSTNIATMHEELAEANKQLAEARQRLDVDKQRRDRLQDENDNLEQINLELEQEKRALEGEQSTLKNEKVEIERMSGHFQERCKSMGPLHSVGFDSRARLLMHAKAMFSGAIAEEGSTEAAVIRKGDHAAHGGNAKTDASFFLNDSFDNDEEKWIDPK